MKKSRVYNLSDEEFQKLISSSTSISECCKKIGLSVWGSNGRRQIKKRCQELKIDCARLSTTHHSHKCNPQKQEYSKILIENSEYTNMTRLKERLIRDNLLEYKCSCCGNTGEWNGKPLVLQLHHLNGVRTDKRLENLTLLCPNCHTQTDNYGAKNIQITPS